MTGSIGGLRGTDAADAFGEGGDDRRGGAKEGDEAGGGDGSSSHGANVGLPEDAWAHAVDGRGTGVDGEAAAEEVDGRHHDEPGEDSAREHDRGDADADDVANAEVFGGAIGADGGAFEDVLLAAEVGLVVWAGGPEREEIVVLEEGVEAAETETKEDSGGEAGTALARHQDVGTGGSFGIKQSLMLGNDELAAQGDHEQDTKPSAEEREGEDSYRLEIET
jgi:hypothetical protein